MTDPNSPPQAEPSKHEQRSAAMRARICEAAVRCLDMHGYAETTLGRIQAEAAVSRGALMYHFSDRHDIIAATAARLLGQSLRPIEARKAAAGRITARSLLQEIWERVVNTAGGRAMLEILVACRTDAVLNQRLAPQLREWDRASLASITGLYSGAGQAPDDAEVLWSIARSFVRGLIIHEQFVSSPEYLHRMLARFADLIEPQLQLR
ncbi:TetR/AcrR family transcriptional regulator [Cribrihabitans neustonicus]|uniref:TetR/AcrR family transcriptional regulator n=1 Tax=Cribrihabitans neustonicus TaxID=1429085 RepID=UPI003B5C5ED1